MLAGKIFAVLIGLASLALAAKSLGAEQFGILVVLQTYVLVFRDVVNVRSAQAIVRYGASYLAAGQTQRFQALLRLSTLLDFTGAVLCVGISLIALTWLGPQLNIPPDLIAYACAYCLTTLIFSRSVAIGFLSLTNRFDLLSLQTLVLPTVRLAGAALSVSLDLGVRGFIVTWIAADVLAAICLVSLGFCTARANPACRDFSWSAPLQASAHNGIASFLFNSNLHTAVNQAAPHLILLVAGGMLGLTSASLLKIAMEIAGIFSRMAQILADTIYPEIAHRTSRAVRTRLLPLLGAASFSGLLLATATALPLLIFLAGLLTSVAGEAYLAASDLTMLLVLAASISVVAFPMEPMLFALGQPGRALIAKSLVLGTQLMLLVPVAHFSGLAGIGLLMLISAAVLGLCLTALAMTAAGKASRTG